MPIQEARDGQILQREPRHVEDGDLVRGTLDRCRTREDVTDFRARQIRRPLALADAARLIVIVDDDARAFQHAGRQFALAGSIGAHAGQVGAWLHRIRVEQGAAAGRGRDHHVAIGDRIVAVAGHADRASFDEVRFECRVRLAADGHVLHRAPPRQQRECVVELHARLHARAEHAEPRAVAPRELLQPEAAGGAGSRGGDRVAVHDAQRAARRRIEQCDGGLMRLAADGSIGRPESGRLEAEQMLAGDVARLDAEHAAGMQLLAHHREYASGPLTVQHEGFAHGCHHLLGLQGGLDGIAVEEKEAGVSRHGRELFGAGRIESI
ncbi:hypothetical protein BCEN4_470015 [Burkholderia cenocepacia]|nr:hypothetical protein BCEN4_470015 [Burkholderia cenocepacia]